MLDMIFMLTANSVEHVITVDLPKQDNEQVTASDYEKNILVTLYPESRHWDVNGEEFHHWEAVKQAITAVHQMQPDAHNSLTGKQL